MTVYGSLIVRRAATISFESTAGYAP